MKKLLLLILICVLFTASFCSYVVYKLTHRRLFNNDISIHVKENSDRYQVNAYYDRARTGRVERYLDAQLHTGMFHNTRINANITLDDLTKLYVRSAPGRLLIRLDKDDNTTAAYWRIKQLGEGLKKQLAN